MSELLTLRKGQINLNQGVIRILGKGNREHLVPLGEEAMDALKEFCDGPRGEILLERQDRASGSKMLIRHPANMTTISARISWRASRKILPSVN